MEEIVQESKMKSIKQRFWEAIRRPAGVFIYLKEKPTILAPFLLRASALIIFLIVSAPITAKLAVEQLSGQAGQIPPQQLESATRMMQSPLMTVIAVISGLFALVIIWLLQAGVFNLIGSAWGDNQKYKVSLSLVSYAWVPLILRQILQSLAVLLSGEMVRPGLSALLSAETVTEPTGLSAFLSYLDLFSVWNLILLIIGISAIHKISRARSAVLVLGYWAAAVLLAVAASSLPGLIGG